MRYVFFVHCQRYYNRDMKKLYIGVLVAAVLGGLWFVWQQQGKDTGSKTSEASSKIAFNKKQFSLEDPSSIWVIVNKKRPLQPADYAPYDAVTPDVPRRLSGADEMQLRKEVAEHVKELFTAAHNNGLELMISSAYRSYAFQKGLYNGYVRQQGQSEADTQSARPGFSEHQTGLALDVEPASRTCEIDACFADTPEGQWVAKHAYRYGFIIRYPEEGQKITGYIYEPWHLRYVGKALAAELHTQGNPTLEEFFNLPPAPDYGE